MFNGFALGIGSVEEDGLDGVIFEVLFQRTHALFSHIEKKYELGLIMLSWNGVG